MLARDETGDLAAKIDFLRTPDAYRPKPARVESRQTHMSWVFLVGPRVYKLKKPVRFAFLDYSTLARREAACRAELAINRRLAPGVYRKVVPLARADGGLAIGGSGEVVDWLVVMRRLPEAQMLDNALVAGTVGPTELDRLGRFLAHFYRHARPVAVSPTAYLAAWRRRLVENRRVLSDTGAALDAFQVAAVDRAQRRFLRFFADLIAERAGAHRIVDGHGDLRPEHIHIDAPLAVIDRLEFSRNFRIVDPFDELAFLGIECDLLGAPAAGRFVAGGVAADLGDFPHPLLFSFYRSYRAAMRARLMIAHLSEPDGHSLGRWRALARGYLAIAAGEALALDRACDARQRRPSREQDADA